MFIFFNIPQYNNNVIIHTLMEYNTFMQLSLKWTYNNYVHSYDELKNKNKNIKKVEKR